MLRITIDLVPYGIEELKKTLYTATIANTGTGSLESGNYRYSIPKKDGSKWKSGEVSGFPRLKQTAWHLLNLILKDAFDKKIVDSEIKKEDTVKIKKGK